MFQALDPFDALLKDKNDAPPADTSTPTTSQAETINAIEDDDDDHNTDQVDGEIEDEDTPQTGLQYSTYFFFLQKNIEFERKQKIMYT